MNSVKDLLNKNDRSYSFEIFGYDIMIDQSYKVYLIDFKYREYDRQQKKKIGEDQKPVTSKKIFI